ncbi:helix-turn-helix domain-containing protein [Clostridium sp. ASF356]|uniref:helix-turn-helix domain-containing protein n=1 Tax=Clostridium sp. MD294 TaxID=97138 RepID=UPI000A005D4B|nr:helix-turn-helix domain-containing protein [Clostridium sp. MD294]
MHITEAIDNVSITKTALAKKANISVNTLNQTYKGKNISATSASTISKALGYQMDFLFQQDTQHTTLQNIFKKVQ